MDQGGIIRSLLYDKYVFPFKDHTDKNVLIKSMQEGYWHYIDHLSTQEKINFTPFVYKLAKPLRWSWEDTKRYISEFQKEQRKCPRFGGILLNAERTHCLLIKAPKGKFWTLPGGKMEKEDFEDGVKTAIREVHEEVGYVGEPNQDMVIHYRRNGAPYTMYVFQNVPFDYTFKTKYPQEIKFIQWFPLTQLRQHVKYAGKIQPYLDQLLENHPPCTKLSLKTLIDDFEKQIEEKNTPGKTKTCHLYTPVIY